MSSTQGFTFPPPPPPPPPKQQQQQQQQQNAPSYGQSYNGHRGGRGRGRGRGFGHRGSGRGGGNYAATQPAPSTSVGYAPMNYAGYTAQPTPGISAPQYGVAPNYAPSTTFPNQAFQQGYNGLYNQPTGQTPHAYPSTMPPYQNQSSSAQPMVGMPMPWGYGQTATGMHSGAPNENMWNPQQSSNNGYGNQVANGGNPMKQPMNKRDHSSAFGKPQSTAPRVPAPPAVPSFGNPLPSKPPPPSEAMRVSKKKKRQHNQLGLTPKTEEHESSEEEDGVDEESKFASRGDGGSGGVAAPLKFSYRGRTATLQTPEDIAKWIEERKKRFPTQARVEEKKKVMEEAKKAREEALKQKRESRKGETKRLQKDSRGPDQQKASHDPIDAATKATQKAEKLRQKLLREQKRVAKAEADAKRAQLKVEALQKESQCNEAGGIATQTAEATEHVTPAEKTGESQMEAAEISSSSDMSGDSDWTSSSGSDESSSESESDSNSDDDSAPEEMTSRREGPERVPPPPRENAKKRVCRHFARNGRCLRGDTCNFLHELPDRKVKNKPAPQKGRQGLLQMVCSKPFRIWVNRCG